MTRQQKIKEIISRLKKLFPDSKIALKYSSPWELFVAVVLSAQTTDKQVNVVTGDLFLKYKSLEDYINTPLEEFQNDIKRIGLYKNKGKNIKLSAEIVYKKYDGKLPDSMENLIKLPGVGRKTANVLLGNIYGKSEGIAVDTHVHRISNRLGWVRSKSPEETEERLKKILPQELWSKVNMLFVDHGQKICLPIKPKCRECRIMEYCRYGKKNL